MADLEQAVNLAPNESALWSDLAAARMQRFETAGDANDLILALAAADCAVERSPSFLEGRFNRALALEWLALGSQAMAEWQGIAQKETDPDWRREAQMHAIELKRPARTRGGGLDLAGVEQLLAQRGKQGLRAQVVRSPGSFREYAEGVLLGEWASAASAGRRQEAESALNAARAIGDALVAAHGEPMTAETVAQIDHARRDEPARLRFLTAGLAAYRQGLDLANAGRFADALLVFRQAERALARGDSPFVGWIDFQIALCKYQNLDYPRASRQLTELLHRLPPGRYRALQGRSHLLAGLIDTIEGRHTAAIISYEAALSEFHRLHEGAMAAKASFLLAEAQASLGQRETAWRTLVPALREAEIRDRPDLRQTGYVIAAWMASSQGELDAAQQFHEEVVRSALALGQPYRVAGSLRSRASLLAALNRTAEARRSLDEAWVHWQQIPNPATRRSMEGDLRLIQGELAKVTAPRQALASFDRAVQLFRSTAYHFKLAQALFERASVLVSLGRSAEAEQDLALAIAECERQRERIDPQEQRISYFDQTRDILDAMVELQLEGRHRPATAFSYSERARARALLDWILAQPSGPMSPMPRELLRPGLADPASLQYAIPTGTTVLAYWTLPRSLVIWVLQRDGFTAQPVSVDRPTVEELVQRLSGEIAQGRRDAVLRTSTQLYDLLVRPVLPHLRPGDRLVAVPDGALHGLSFALLRDAQTARFLVEDHILSVAPSVRVFLASLARDSELATAQPPHALVVSDPAFDEHLFPTLIRLRSTSTEMTIRRSFRGSLVLRDRAATRRAFLATAGQLTVVHFGGHSIVNPEYPLLSQMVFAADPTDPNPGVLYSGDILRQRFPQTRLVVLASCSSAAGKISRTEGVESLARPFMAAGVPAVVASIWDVDDELTGKLFSRFYSHLKESFDSAAALRQAQLEGLATGSSPEADPRSWAAFELIGGSVVP